jgi:hypothetical protein
MKKTESTTPFDASTIASMANAKSKGQRPAYFSNAMDEQHYAMTMALVAELASARERIDTLERVLISKGLLSDSDIEDYRPDFEAGKERQLAQAQYSARIFRPMQQAIESMKGNDISVSDMARQLGEEDA